MSKIENAVEKAKGPCVVFAGAGTGKTRAIVEKVKYLIEKGIYKPERIVCLTFSNEAANHLLARIRTSLVDESAKELGEKEPIVRTFHGFSADLLRKFGEKEEDKKFNILEPDEAKVVLHRHLQVLPMLCHDYVNNIGIAKDLDIRIEAIKEYVEEKIKKSGLEDIGRKINELEFALHTIHLKKDRWAKRDILDEFEKLKKIQALKKFVCAWGAYEKLKEKKKYKDYADLNCCALRLLKENPKIAENFDYVIVDEFQDTNKIQLELLFALCLNRDITIVGDMNQSIYRFRGAYQRNIDEFKEHFGVGKEDIFCLDKSYRSPNKVLRVAHELIKNNYTNGECFFVENAHEREGEKIEVFEMKDAKEEARKISEIVEAEVKKGRALNDICVLFRAHQYGRVIKRALENKGIAYCSVSKQSLFKQQSVKIVIDYLRILEKISGNLKGGEDAWWDLIYRSNFSQNDLILIGKFIKSNQKENISKWIIENIHEIGLSDDGRLRARIIVERIKLLLDFANKNVEEIVKEIYKLIGVGALGEEQDRDVKEVIMNLNKFYELAKKHSELYENSLSGFIYYLDILAKLGIEIDAVEIEEEGVRLMTLHATKGLEFKVVIVSNLAQKRFPVERYNRSSLIPLELFPELRHMENGESDELVLEYEKKHGLMEERRLGYVAFTRAKENLFLTYAQDYGGKRTYPSKFLEEIKFRNNSDVVFKEDKEEKWHEPEIRVAEELEKSRVEKDVFAKRVLSPSALLLFEECQKKFEYRYVYNMPEPKGISWEAMRLGSFIHRVLERGVGERFDNANQFKEFARALSLEDDWKGVELEDALLMIEVFFERNKGKYDKNSKTEQELCMTLGGLKFHGFADRIDFSPRGIEIIDYKTGKSDVSPLGRNWQLGYYALAASRLGKVRKVVLDMLRQEKPLEFEIDDKGNAVLVHEGSRMKFNIYEVEEELVKCASAIYDAYEKGFKPCAPEKNCEFCNEYIYKT